MITPLKSISLLSKSIAQQTSLDNTKDATLVYSTSQLLLSEVMLLLDRNQLDKSRFQPNLTSISVNQTIKSTISLLRLQSKMQQVKIRLEKLPEDVMLELDEFRTRQVVINLLSNALKFSKAFDIIHVKLKVVRVGLTDDTDL